MIISRQQCTVYFAPSARRRYMSLAAATNAEAWTRMNKKYPVENAKEPFGYWDWSHDPHLVKVFERYRRMLGTKIRRELKTEHYQVKDPAP